MIVLLTDGGFDSEWIDELTKANRVDGNPKVMISAVGFKIRKDQTLKNLIELTKFNGGSLRIVDLSKLSE